MSMYALLYTRVSHDEQVRNGASLDAQLDALKQYCHEHNYTIKGIYTDEGISGASVKKRKGLSKMLSDASKGDTILFTKLDRFSRNLLDANILVQELDERGIGIKAIHEDDIDTTSADGKFMFNIKMSLAQREREKTSERIRDVFDFKVANGEVTSGSVPLGYKIENKRLVIDQDTKDIALFVFETYDRCGNVQQTHKEFVKRYGDIRCIRAIRMMLQNEKYIGKNGSNSRFCEPLIDIDLFDRTQKRLSLNVKKPPSKEVYLFAKLIECPRCHGNMFAYVNHTKTSTHHYYRCTGNQYAKRHRCDFTTVREDRIEAELIDKVGIFASETKYQLQKANNTDSTQKEVDTIKKKLERLKDLYIDGDINKQAYLRKKNAFERDLLEHEQSIEMTEKASVNEILTLNLKEIYEGLSQANKSAFWHRFIERIHVDEEGHVVHIDFL